MLTKEFVTDLPKAELHVHIEGTLEPELKLKLAKKNGIELDQKTIADVKNSLKFNDLVSFLNVYYPAMEVLQTESDFYELAMEYLVRAKKNGIKHAEIFFDPQAHTSRGIEFSTVIEGLSRAVSDARSFGIDAQLIMCFLRDFSAKSADQTLKQAEPYRHLITGVGLDSDEHHNPPLKFARQFSDAMLQGYKQTMHADVDQLNSIQHIKDALEVIGVQRLDHGTNIVEDADLVEWVAKTQVGLTSCPLSNSLVTMNNGKSDNKGKEVIDLLEKDVLVTINSDDPAYFGGYIVDNYLELINNNNLSEEQVIKLAKNSFKASWISNEMKEIYLQQVDEYVETFNK
ncbi:adenine deaminase [Companilactobacillus sp. RD055328]|uniref:adenosine deaminase n=1 Tax=Companilactobacillus sp. RD055328 TaxID=2916634 RepID=UPI001FC8B985|nr:adenosine deaminase [Companilactobacillus sp. RD055328]GKQ42779.1 adenine deaminase [Companilactobacillus sp. RD055328]